MPQRPLEPLDGSVEAVVEGDEATDWRLTTSDGRIADAEVTELFDRWRRRWSVSTPLETVFNVSRLHHLVDELRPDAIGSTWVRAVGRVLSTGEPDTITPDELPALRADCETLGDAIRARGQLALGAIDTTLAPAAAPDDGEAQRGLAAGWATGPDDRLVAADQTMSVTVTADRRLVVRATRDVPVTPSEVGDELVTSGIAIREVEISSDGVTFVGAGRADAPIRMPLASAGPLTWLVPGSSSWRVRDVPEVLIWARSLVTLPDLCDEALGLDRSIRLSLGGPVAALSASGPRT